MEKDEQAKTLADWAEMGYFEGVNMLEVLRCFFIRLNR